MNLPRRAMSVRDLLEGRNIPGSSGDIRVSGLALDSRRVSAGDAFVALAGTRMHGITFAPAASDRGAVVVLAETPVTSASAPDVSTSGKDAGDPVPVVWIDDLRDALGSIASRFNGDPSHHLTIVGVTGTNGKTSAVQLLAQALQQTGRTSATIGTLGAGMYGHVEASERTTPDAIAVHGLLGQFLEEGATHVAMEVSSHALEQGRVNAVAFDLAVFTNLTRDHLDYHGSMAAYGAAKQRLFSWPGLRAAIINFDDAFGRALATTIPHGIAVLRYGIERDDADVIARALETAASGQEFDLITPWGEGRVRTPLLGRFNISNLLAVAACLGQLGFGFDDIQSALMTLEPVAGRMSRLGGSAEQPLVVVDYAHTPDALEQALTSLRAHCSGRLICVFGCGGERDEGKRPQMGAIAEALANTIIVTDDNPRSEDGDLIVAQIVAGLARPQEAIIERDRAAAIRSAIEQATRSDVVLVAGKGHEPYQEIGGTRYPFDDLKVARQTLEQRAC